MAKQRRQPSRRTRRAQRVRKQRRRSRLLLHSAIWGGLAVAAAVMVWAVVAVNTEGSSAEIALGPNDRVLGDPSAPMTIVEYADFKCPFCARFFAETESRLREEYIETGLVRFVWRDFPNIDSESPLVARAGRCAGAQGRFWEFHDAAMSFIWDNFYGRGINVEGQAAYEGELDRLAAEAGLDVETFRGCLDSGRHAELVEQDLGSAAELGVRGTPTFFVNGQKVVGAQPFDVFSRLIDAEVGR
ncbi:MAG: thioredoxin domain-containing protein [Dehalococcoidia bacterium]